MFRSPPAPRSCRPLLLALLASTALLPLTAQAQDVTDLSAIAVEGDDDSTTIAAKGNGTGSKMETDALDSSASVSVITAKEIETRGAKDLEEILSYTAGVVTDEWGGGDDRYDTYRIRGFDEMALGTYRDGLPVRGFGWTYSRREPYAYERVEVLKGSTSSLYGLNAPGGLVNAVTKTPKSYRFGEAYTTLGKDHTEVGTDFGDVLNKSGTLSYRVTAKVQDGAKTYDYSNDDRKFALLSLSWTPSSATKLTTFLEYNQRNGTPGTGLPADSGLDPSTFLGEPDFNRVDTTERSVGWMFDHDFGGGLSFHQVGRYSSFDMDYEEVYGASTDASADRSSWAVYSDSRQMGVDNRLQFDGTFGGVKSRTLVGAEYTWIKVTEKDLYGTAGGIDIYDPQYCGTACIDLSTVYYDWVPELTTKAVYAQQEFTFADKWIVTGGLRYDDVDMKLQDNLAGTTTDTTYTKTTGRLGLTYKATPNLSVFANYSQSFNPPDVFSEATEPTEGTQYEVGVKYRPEGMNALFTASYFDLTQTNVRTQTSPTTYATIGKVGVRGLELEAKGELTKNLDLTASWSLWDAEIREDGISGNTGNRPAFVPKQVAALWADWTLPGNDSRGDLTLGGGLRYVGQSYSDDANTSSQGARTLVDVAMTYALQKNVDLSLNVTNLFDKQYVAVNYYGTNYYGEGREVSATLRYRW
ncbi:MULTISPECIES: TonB-dependent siderophore receptor [Pseudooceanicola]|uniref:TonB-dependent siderophore receptor n=1 Tax=Pseudooceanicola TaxID=1679449 RepID=UPI0028807FA0|nr:MULTISPECIES: TonB-dependent siderophore receptor [Pseudooceanicola]